MQSYLSEHGQKSKGKFVSFCTVESEPTWFRKNVQEWLQSLIKTSKKLHVLNFFPCVSRISPATASQMMGGWVKHKNQGGNTSIFHKQLTHICYLNFLWARKISGSSSQHKTDTKTFQKPETKVAEKPRFPTLRLTSTTGGGLVRLPITCFIYTSRNGSWKCSDLLSFVIYSLGSYIEPSLLGPEP